MADPEELLQARSLELMKRTDRLIVRVNDLDEAIAKSEASVCVLKSAGAALRGGRSGGAAADFVAATRRIEKTLEEELALSWSNADKYLAIIQQVCALLDS